ncbi:MAG: sigma 54-interacting transcriptional regulator [Thermodesulfobacteriota bacterium]
MISEIGLSRQELERVLALTTLFSEDFSIDWIVDLSGLKASQVLLALEEGIRTGLVARKGKEFFAFVDEDQRGFFQEKLPPKERERQHLRIIHILERELPEDESKVLAIARHLLPTTNTKQHSAWLIKAGDINLKSFRMENALQCYAKILDNLAEPGDPEEDRLFIEAAIKYSKVSTAGPETSRILGLLQAAMTRAIQSRQQGYEALLEMQIAKTEWLRSHYQDAVKHFKRGWSLVKTLDDPKLLRSATAFRIIFLFWHGRFKDVIRAYEQLVPEVEKIPLGKFPLLVALTVGRGYVHLGHVTQGLGLLDAVHRLCLERGDKYMASHARFTIGATMMDIRHLDKAVELLDESVREAGREGNDWVLILGNLMLAYARYLNDDQENSLASLKECLRHGQRAQVTVQPYPYLLELALAMEQGSFPPLPGLDLEKEIDRVIKGNNVFTKGAAYRYRAIRQRRAGQPSQEVFRSLDRSLRLLEDSGHLIGQSKTLLEMARQHLLLEDETQARSFALRAARLLAPFSEAIIPEDLRFLIKDSYLDKNLLKEILKLGQELVTIRDNKILVQKIISTVNGLTGAERGAIFRLEKYGPAATVKLRASRNLTPEQIGHPGFESSMKMIENAAATGQGLIEGPSLDDERAKSEEEAIRSRICMPMILRDKVVGVLYHDNRLLSSAFKESDLELLAYFAAQAALALDNASAYEEIQRLNQRLKKEKEYYREEHLQEMHFDEIVGESKAIKQVLKQVRMVADTDTTVLIIGETGVGKELVARAIHQQSPRRNKPFIRVHTGALPENLIPSELFGHEKGAFTGALQRHVGRFELADEGSLFMDEISEIPLEVQTRLLRVLQSKEFERVGGGVTLKSDFRLIAATNRDLLEEVKKERFRADLYYRINVFPVFVPPLRDRREDIPLLADHFLKICAEKIGRSFDGIPAEEMDKLVQYDWPGNVRELHNVIERGAILNSGSYFHVPDLGVGGLKPTSELISSPEIVTLEENERRHIRAALNKCGWKVRGAGGAAEVLALNPSTLAFRMKKLGLRRPNKTST